MTIHTHTRCAKLVLLHALYSSQQEYSVGDKVLKLKNRSCLCNTMNPDSLLGTKSILLYCIVLIHFYSASHGISLSEVLPTTAIDTVSEFTRRSPFNCN